MGDFSDEWDGMKERFYQATGKKKPSKKFAGKIRKSANIDSCLKKLDKADCEQKRGDAGIWDGTAYNKFLAAFEDFKKSSKKYLDFLDDVILEEAPDKEENRIYYNHLKLLKKDLDAFTKRLKLKVKGAYQNLQELNQFERSAANFRSALKSGVAKALVAIQKIKNEPTPQTYNAQFPRAGRDVTQTLGNLRGLVQEYGGRYPLPSGMSDQADQFFDDLMPWANDFVATGEGTSENDIKRMNKDFSRIIKEVKAAFGV